MPKYLDLTNQRFGRLVATKDAGRTNQKRALWLCVCDCGNTKVIRGYHLGKGISSCGCLEIESRKSHGLSKHYLYRTWANIIQRCYNVNNKQYKDYGGRGISVCQRWRVDFSNFLADMGERPEGLTVERVDNDLGYMPENCKWATRSEQQFNRRNSKTNEVNT